MLSATINRSFESASDSCKNEIFDASMLYCVRYYGAFEYQRRLKEIFVANKIKTSPKAFRMILSQNSWFLLNLKFFCASYTMNNLALESKRELLRSAIKIYCIKKADFVEFRRFIKTRRNKKAVASAFCTNDTKQIMTVNEARTAFQTMFTPIHRYCKYITQKKLRFIIRSNNMSHDDMHCELMTKAIRTFYTLIPSPQTDEYVLNYVKRAVHNHAINIIKQYKFGKRDRLQSFNDNSEFKLCVVSENQFAQSSVDGTETSLDNMSHAIDQNFDKYEISSTCLKMFRRQKPAIKKLLSLLLGEYDAEFTKFLHKKKAIRKTRDNAHYYDCNISKNVEPYKNYAFQFLGIDSNEGNNLLKNIYRDNFGV